MIVFSNMWARLFFWASQVLFGLGFAIFLKNIFSRNDRDYEMRFPWSLRGLAYLFAGMLWFVGIPVAVGLYCDDPGRRKFAMGLLWVSAVGVCFLLAGVIGLAIA